VWKSDYINLGAGAEIGFYVRDGIGLDPDDGAWWKTVANAHAPDMSESLSGSSGAIATFDPDVNQSWVAVFASRTQDPSAASLTADYEVSFDDHEMYEDFRDDWEGNSDWIFNDSFTAKLQFRRKRRGVDEALGARTCRARLRSSYFGLRLASAPRRRLGFFRPDGG
jgi:hypothetical protein